MNSIITAARLLNGDAIVENPIVTVDDGHIVSIRSRDGYPLPTPAAARSALFGLSRRDLGSGLPRYPCTWRRWP